MYCVFADYAPHLEIKGGDNPLNIENQTEISCHITYYWEATTKAKITWILGRKEIISNHSFSRTVLDNLANYVSVLDYTLSQDDDMATLTCAFSASSELEHYETSAYTVVSLQRK